MDRLTKTLAGCGLALMAAAAGCRSAHDEVPPGKVYRPEGRPDSAVGFSTSQPEKGYGAYGTPPNLTQGNIGGGGLMGSRPVGGDMTGTVPGNRFGGPGTSGAASTSPSPATSPSTGGGSLSGLGQAPALQPSATPREDPNYLNGFPTQPPAAGAMGSPGQPPSPL